jgi:hypothetical protein
LEGHTVAGGVDVWIESVFACCGEIAAVAVETFVEYAPELWGVGGPGLWEVEIESVR